MWISNYLSENLYHRATMVEAIRFGLVGVVNTGITLTVIFVLMKVLGVHYAVSNILGYALGLCLARRVHIY